jgi:ring-1,2-phenylacetyl-CoA epoxidase subunit PaaD
VSSVASPATNERIARAWAVLSEVLDPEVPAISIVDLGIVRAVIDRGDRVEVVLTPTYSGCPATEAIEAAATTALDDAGLGPAYASMRRAPAWTTDWITPMGRKNLAAYGIAPPGPRADGAQPLRFFAKTAIPCPRCGSSHTERLAAFGATACKALHRCLACSEPFEHFKPI